MSSMALAMWLKDLRKRPSRFERTASNCWRMLTAAAREVSHSPSMLCSRAWLG